MAAMQQQLDAAWAQRSADMMKSAARSNDMIVAQYAGLWAREGETFLNAQAGRERSGQGGWRHALSLGHTHGRSRCSS